MAGSGAFSGSRKARVVWKALASGKLKKNSPFFKEGIKGILAALSIFRSGLDNTTPHLCISSRGEENFFFGGREGKRPRFASVFPFSLHPQYHTASLFAGCFEPVEEFSGECNFHHFDMLRASLIHPDLFLSKY